MTDGELEQLLDDCPILFHMTSSGSWANIRQIGLLSTSALLDRYGIEGDSREKIEGQRRPAVVTLTSTALPSITVRDQIPMDDRGLRRALPQTMSPADWYRIINSKVFFWLSRRRLLRLLAAGAYKSTCHDVLELDARPLVEAYRDAIWLSPMNSGCTKPFPHPRDATTFRRITDYPYADWRTKRSRQERAVELAVDYAVANVEKYVLRVSRMRFDDPPELIFER